MADLSQTAANVKVMSNTSPSVGLAGETLTQGQPVYVSGGKWYRCEADSTAAKANCGGIVLTAAASDGYFLYAIPGASINVGATLAVGTVYAVSAAIGAICPVADITSTQYVTVLGVATAAGTLPLNIIVSGVVVP